MTIYQICIVVFAVVAAVCGLISGLKNVRRARELALLLTHRSNDKEKIKDLTTDLALRRSHATAICDMLDTVPAYVTSEELAQVMRPLVGMHSNDDTIAHPVLEEVSLGVQGTIRLSFKEEDRKSVV